MRFEIDPQPEETQRACTAIAKATLPSSQGGVTTFAVYAAVVAAAYFLTPESRAVTAFIGIAAVLATIMGLQAEGRRRMRRLQRNDPHSRETHFVEIDPEGVRTWCSHVDARYPWADFAKVTEDKEFFVLARASGQGAVIPKRIVDDAQDVELRAKLREWSPDRGASLAREQV